MNHPDYFVAFENYRDSTLDSFTKLLLKMPKKVVGDIKLSELCSMTDYPNGLYLFFDEFDELWYVGKSTSRSFIERIPAHFDQRQNAWFNTLPIRIMTMCSIVEYADAHAIGLKLRVAIIGMKSKKAAIKFESVLRSYMKPKLNNGKSSKYSSFESLSSYEA
jgi:hypothetical protein